MSDTPRTDSLLSGIDSFGNIPTMEDRYQRMCRHARQLETESASLIAAVKTCHQAFALQALRDCSDPDMLEGWRKLQRICDAALSAATKGK